MNVDKATGEEQPIARNKANHHQMQNIWQHQRLLNKKLKDDILCSEFDMSKVTAEKDILKKENLHLRCQWLQMNLKLQHAFKERNNNVPTVITTIPPAKPFNRKERKECLLSPVQKIGVFILTTVAVLMKETHAETCLCAVIDAVLKMHYLGQRQQQSFIRSILIFDGNGFVTKRWIELQWHRNFSKRTWCIMDRDCYVSVPR